MKTFLYHFLRANLAEESKNQIRIDIVAQRELKVASEA